VKNDQTENQDLKFKYENGFRSISNEKLGRLARSFFESIQVVVIALFIVVIIYVFVASFNIVDGESMLPNFTPRDLIISEKITTNFGNLQRGDVIVFESSSGKDFIKRIIGLPHDKVKIVEGKVYVNGTALNEFYLSEDNKYVSADTLFSNGKEIEVPTDNYIVLGDNRKNSLDSRKLGPIEKNKIRAKAWVVLWPMDKTHIVQHVRYPELGDK